MKKILALAFGLVLGVPLAFAADQAFKDFVPAQPAAAAQGGTETLPEVQSAATKKVTTAQLATYVLGTPLTSSVVIGKWSGTCNASSFLRGDGACAAAGTGTVTSVALTTPSWLSVAGSPVTTSGTLAVTATTGQTANSFLATPDGSTGAVSLRTITLNDIPTIPLATKVSGILPVANGGTNNAFFTVAGPATSAKTYTFPNASANILTDNAAVTTAQGGTGLTSATDDAALVGNGTSWAATAIPNCGSSTQALAYSTSTNAFSCQTVTGSGGSPAGSNTQVQFNNSGAFGADAGFTYNSASDLLVLGESGVTPHIQGWPGSSSASASLIIETQAGPAGFASGSLTLQTGAGGSSSSTAGDLNITAGAGGTANGNGGNIAVTSGAASGSGTAGTLTVRGGAGGATSTGAAVSVIGGAGGSTSGAAGAVSMTGGTPVDGNGGAASLTGSAGVGTNRSGGNATVAAGARTGSGTEGVINFNLAGTTVGQFTTSTAPKLFLGTSSVVGTLSGPNASTPPGLTLRGGDGTGGTSNGGDITIQPGTSANNAGSFSGNLFLISGITNGGSGGYLSMATGANTERFRILANGAWSVGSTGSATGTSGQVLTSNGSSAVPTWQTPAAAPTILKAVATSDLSRASTTTQTADSTLVLSGVAAGTYSFTGNIQFNFAGSGTNPGALMGILTSVSPSNTSRIYAQCGGTNGSAGVGKVDSTGTSAQTFTFNTDLTTPVACILSGTLIIASSTDVSLTWAQVTSNATATVRQAGSWIRMEKLL